MPDTIDDVRRIIESRLAEIEAEAGQLERALSQLGDGDGPGRRRGRGREAAPSIGPPPRDGARRPRRPRSARRARRGQRREELLAAIKASPGSRPSELAAAIGIPSTQVSALVAKARAEKLIVKSGAGYALR